MARFISLNEALDIALLGNDDVLKRSKGRLLKWAKYVYQDLNLSSMRIARREFFEINKRTNTVDLPCEFLKLSSVNVMDHNGVIYPVWRNDRLHDDMVDISAKKDCACEKGCSYKVCNTVKGYEAVISTKSDYLPNGDPISFTCVDRKAIDDNGFLYEETQYPLRQYLSGVWTDTILYTEQKKLCKLETDDNGCICDTEENINAVCGCLSTESIPYGGTSLTPPCEGVNTWKYYCNSKLDWFMYQCGCFDYMNCANIYNISELGDRLIFPSNFPFDKVLIRYYADVDLRNMQIPFIALDTFVAGLKWWDVRFNDKKQNIAPIYEVNYTKLKWGLLGELNKYRLAELRMISTPPTIMPSYNSQINTNYYVR